MTYKTHREYSVTFAFLAIMLIYSRNMTQINYYLALIIILMTSKSGALFPDIDHNWENVKEKSVINYIINKLIHLTNGKHRSWQTHSIDICVIYTALSIFLPQYLYLDNKISNVNKEVLSIILIGFATGWISHLFSDMLTYVGVRPFCWSKIKLKFVPKKLFGLRFNTGNSWEEFNYKTMRFMNIILGILSITYPFWPSINQLIRRF